MGEKGRSTKGMDGGYSVFGMKKLEPRYISEYVLPDLGTFLDIVITCSWSDASQPT